MLGLNSGTSADGIDLAVVRSTRGGTRPRVRLLAGKKVRFTPAVRTRLVRFINASSVSLDEVIETDRLLGQLFGKAAAAFLAELKRRQIRVDAVASHGQTVRHHPSARRIQGMTVQGTLQLGHLETIAACTGLPVIGDFRQSDVALGNEGAPITTGAMLSMFGDPRHARLIVNIGGIANYFYIPPDQSSVQAADCGPGNSLCDLLAQCLFSKPYDRDGRIALSGTVSRPLLLSLLRHPYFSGSRQSTGREDFGARLAERMIADGRRLRLTKRDLLATAAELTVVAIVQALAPIVTRDRSLDSLFLTGGGLHNDYFRRRLARLLPGIRIASIAELGASPELVEAAAYAVIGSCGLRGLPMPTQFGGRKPQRLQPVLGRIVQPPASV